MTPLIALIFGSKVVMVVKGLGKGEESLSMTKPMAAKFIQKPKTNSHVMGSTTSSSGFNLDGDIQEELRKIFIHLDSLKEKNARMGNRQLVSRITAMLEAAGGILPSTDSSHRESSTQLTIIKPLQEKLETKVSDGIVIKPYVNNILANVTDKIVCATLQEPSPECLNRKLSGHTPLHELSEHLSRRLSSYAASQEPSCDLSNQKIPVASCPKLNNLDQTDSEIHRIPELSIRKRSSSNCEGNCLLHCKAPSEGVINLLELPQVPLPSYASDNESFRCCRNDSLSECGSPISINSLTIPVSPISTLSSHSDYVLPRSPNPQNEFSGLKEADKCTSRTSREKLHEKFFKKNGSLANQGNAWSSRKLSPLMRGWKSMDESAFIHARLPEMDSCLNKGFWSCHSTPRKLPQLSDYAQLKEIKDPLRARVYILYSLSDRSNFTGELTV